MREGAAPKPTEEQKERSAMTTEELLHRLIKMFSFRGDTALDPFMGSGTTSLAAKNLERNSVGYEINPEFIEIAKQKLNTRQPDIKSEPFTHDKAVCYLTEKIKGKRIFLKYDKSKYDNENVLLCYLYLENKTFVNAHLIKSGLVGVDGSYEYRYRGKFLDMGELVQG